MKGVVLAAGEGRRLRPLTELLPKALCPVGNRPLLDRALERLHTATDDVAVNVHSHREQMEQHLSACAPAVHVSVEPDELLGTAGAIGQLREWIDGDAAVVTNVDALTTPDLSDLIDGWDGERIRLLVAFDDRQPDFDGLWKYVGACVLPWSAVRDLEARPSHLFTERWQPAAEAGTLDLVPTRSFFTDCGTPLRYLGANLVVSGGTSVISEDARVEGTVEASVVWPGARVEAGEHLRFAIRLSDGRTVQPLAS
ncbi:MAG: sugar phosphate nucleotidyltransferase [Acidimicrobiia bacterium]